jgi:hypothetical protein
MNKEPKEIKILNEALERLRANTGLVVDIDELNIRANHGGYCQDAVINIKWEDLDFRFAAEIKINVTPAVLGLVMQRMQQYQERGILIARYITPQMAEEMKRLKIPFIDTAGNAFIYEPPLFVFMKGNRLDDKDRLEQPKRIFRPAGLKVLFALLCNPGLENEPYREIADKADVALGTVGWTMYALRTENYLVEVNEKRRRFIHREALLQRWALEYPNRLRTKQLLGKYRAENVNWWVNTDLADTKALWGGEIAARNLTKYLKPQIITIYAEPPLGRFILKNKLKDDPKGNVEILEKFWKFDIKQRQNGAVPPLLVYADLLATGDPRNIETAGIIYEQELT